MASHGIHIFIISYINVKEVCPICSGQLKYWTESVVERKRIVNPKTGTLSKKVDTIIGDSSEGGNEGIECTRCGWIYNTINLMGSHEVNIPELLENVSSRQIKQQN